MTLLSEAVLGGHLQQPAAEFVGGEAEAGRGRVGGGADAGAIQRKIGLLGISGAKTIQSVVQEIEGRDAET